MIHHLRLLRQSVQALYKAEGKRDRGRALAEVTSIIDRIEQLKPIPLIPVDLEALTLVLESHRDSKVYPKRRKYHVGNFEQYDRAIDLLKASHPEWQRIVL